jgi:Ca2+-binding RTX toxin-like protein
MVGDIIGGDGDDVYKIGKNQIDINEDADEGTDAVYANTSYWLGSHVEHLFLTGKKDLGGGGNEEDNVISGNRGDNTLSGGEGDDTLAGRRGNDFLTGDGGEDWFIFDKGDDKDEILDFTKGDDTIWLTNFDMDFANLQSRMSQHGNDTWIRMGDGDRLIIQDTDAATLEESDFSFSEFPS